MNIRFTSSLTPEDENVIVPALLKAVAGILDLLPIAYVIQIDTSDMKVYQHSGVKSPPRPGEEPVQSKPSGGPVSDLARHTPASHSHGRNSTDPIPR